MVVCFRRFQNPKMPQPEAAIESKINGSLLTSDFTSPIFELYRKDYMLFTLIASGTV
jgi:hypothetical protein